MSFKHESQEDQSNGNSRFFTFKVPSKYMAPILVAIGLGYNPARDMVSAALPQRGNQDHVTEVNRRESDSRLILERLNELSSFSTKLDALDKTCNETKSDVRELTKRVDDLYRKP
jgi:hypothetical protein